MRTAVYIDGFNLYYWLKPTPYRWVDLKLLAANALQAPGFIHEIVSVKMPEASGGDPKPDEMWRNSGFQVLRHSVACPRGLFVLAV